MMIVRVSHASLSDPVADPENRQIMPMSTLVGTDDQTEWLLETTWDGSVIGDIQVFRNKNIAGNGQAMKDPAGKALPPEWIWWAGVPRGKIRSYRLHDRSLIKPGTVEGDEIKLPFDGKRKGEPREAGQKAVQPAGST